VKRLLKRLAPVAVAAMLGMAGTLFLASPASAASFTTTTERTTPLLFCARVSPACPSQLNISAGTAVKDFCTHGPFDLAFSAGVGNRIGFVRRTDLVSEGQVTNCASGGVPVVPPQTIMLQTCASNACPDVGPVFNGNQLREYCQRTGQSVGGDTLWFVVYSDVAEMAGFAPRDLLGGSDNVEAC
jgi:hypothetical protein